MNENLQATEKPHVVSLREAVLKLLEISKPNGLSVQNMIQAFGSRSHAFLILFFSLPFIQPLPMFGLSTPLGLGIALLGVLMAMKKSPWLPKRFAQKIIPFNLIQSCCNTLAKILGKTEKLIKPRLDHWVNLRTTKILDGFLIALFGVLLALPLPIPFSNSVPAYFLVMNAIGWLERDGVVLILSYIIAIFGIIFFFALGGGIFEAIVLFRAKFGI
jgi:hypothetical protein